MADDLSQVNSEEIPTITPEVNVPQTAAVLPIPQAIKELAPGCRWYMEGYDYDGITWEDDPDKKPTKEAVIARAEEILAEVPWIKLRKERDARMKEVDWVTLRAMRTGEEIPQEWKDYMNALADITDTTTNPQIVGGLLVNVEWPTRPDGQPAGAYRGTYSPLAR